MIALLVGDGQALAHLAQRIELEAQRTPVVRGQAAAGALRDVHAAIEGGLDHNAVGALHRVDRELQPAVALLRLNGCAGTSKRRGNDECRGAQVAQVRTVSGGAPGDE